ncbi:hypothetical protein BDD14_2589 [Edaphobacter modestus]|uniref:Uncharacterized protein n=1 Tax=Edaphobacter modestus TaxID=388466 RepID=A0A4Q7YUU7_9BACT|nr:hypothetical protein BDD14_2589 [Edaphobacter modestus]
MDKKDVKLACNFGVYPRLTYPRINSKRVERYFYGLPLGEPSKRSPYQATFAALFVTDLTALAVF